MADSTDPVETEMLSASVRGRLFRRYAWFFAAVVCTALLINGLAEAWIMYQDHKSALIRIQREQAEAAATKIGEFIKGIENNIGWSTQSSWLDEPIAQRRMSAQRLLRQVPAIAEFRPEVLFYQSGVDGLAGDRLGG